jgi:hypothetical protein
MAEPKPPYIEGATVSQIVVTADRKRGLPKFGSVGRSASMTLEIAPGFDPEEIARTAQVKVADLAEEACLVAWQAAASEQSEDEEAPADPMEAWTPPAHLAAPAAPAPAARPAAPAAGGARSRVTGKAADGTPYRVLAVGERDFLKRKVTDKGAPMLKVFVKPFNTHGVDAWSEPCDAKWGQEWLDFPMGKPILLSDLGITEVVVWCKNDNGDPLKVAEFR